MGKRIQTMVDKVIQNVIQGGPIPVYSYSESSLLPYPQAIAILPRLTMSDKLFRELVYYFSRIPKEMQAMGFVEQAQNNCFTVTELVIPPHTSGSEHADLDQDEFIPWLDSLEARGKDINQLRFQAHSHGFGPTYFSNIDIQTIREAYSCDWMISLVGNRSCIFSSRLDVYKPIPLSISLPFTVRSPIYPFSKLEKQTWDYNLQSVKDAKNGENKDGELSASV